MKRRFFSQALGIVVGLLCTLHSTVAIEIVVPDQFKAQVEAAKANEQAERARQLAGVDPAESETAGINIADPTAIAESELAGEDTAAASDDFVMQSVVEAESTAAAFEGNLAADQGLVSGQVLDKESGAPVPGAAIIIEGTDIATVTAEDGRYTLGPAPAGQYTLSFIKSGYIEANVTEYQIAGGEISVFPFALPPRPAEMSDEVYELQDFSVTAEQANELMLALDLRMSSDSIMNVMTSEDFSRFAASDVGDAIKRVAGVTVEGGKFAVIRGLDERYSSTTLNGVPVPSPDPDRQSVPLDLFPSEIVGNLVVAKTFTPDLPGNSAGGSINILTSAYPDEWRFDVKAGTGMNDRAEDRFLERQGNGPRSLPWGEDSLVLQSVGRDTTDAGLVAGDGSAEAERDLSIEAGGTSEFFGRLFRVLASFSHEVDYETGEGTEENRFARSQVRGRPPRVRFTESGDLVLGELPFTSGRFDLTESERAERDTYLISTEIDIDTESEHRLKLTYFKNEDTSSVASLRENGFFPDFIRDGFAEGDLANLTPFPNSLVDGLDEAEVLTPAGPNRQDLLDSFLDARLLTSSVVDIERELEVFQAGSTHQPTNFMEGLDFSWNFSDAEASQEDIDSITVQAVLGPNGNYVVGQSPEVADFFPFFAWRRVVEEQQFLRMDLDYELDFGEDVVFTPSVGFARERTNRDTEQLFLPLVPNSFGDPSQRGGFDTLGDAARSGLGAFPGLGGGVDPFAFAEGVRDMDASYLSGKLTLFEKLDLFGGVRFEKLNMTTSTNVADGSDFFNSGLLRDSASGATPTNAQINTQILGINGSQPLPTDFVGEIDEDVALPSIGVTYRPIEGSRISFAYSETLVRPSFKEFTFVTVQNPVTLDFESGNPALTTSEVTSLDLRLEYTWGSGDLLALGFFHKTIDDPIEKTSLRGFAGNTDIFFNNPNQAELKGIEIEARKTLDFTDNDFLSYFSVGGNLTLIEATVDIPDNFRRLLSGGLEVDINGTPRLIGGGAYAEKTGPGLFDGRFVEPPEERALFQQPEWIANADVSFNHPDWGTSATLSVFAQSEVLDRAGGFLAEGSLSSVDEYRKSFHEVNFTLSQRLNDFLTLSFSVKNLTDSERGIEYDDIVGGDKRSFRVGRDYSIAITGSF